ncbi:MAG: C10 family peptidase, partial [Bacteroidota bacterium]
MKRKITFSLFLAALILPAALNAAVVDVFTAKQAAKNFYYARNYQTVKSYESISLQTLLVRNEAAQPVYYVFSTPEKGFVIMSADDAVTPVLGYSFTNEFSVNDNSPAFDSWMQTYVDIIMLSRQNGTQANEEIQNAWKSLMNSASAIESMPKGSKAVTPLLVSTWNQDKYYNELAPADPASAADGHAYAGCVATAMGQIMNYFKYPLNGNGSKTYTANNAYLGYGDYGTLSANFGATWYEWNGMPNNLIERNLPVATLLYHAGVSVSMMFGPNASGAQSTSVAPALVNYFRYKNTLTLISRDTYGNDTRWKDSLKSSLNRKTPIYYSGDGNATGTGHAFVCDGYNASDMFHFNWGWSGSGDGYFAVTALSPSGNNFTYHQAALINISPITTAYPYYCSGTTTLNWTAGTFEDGSSPQKNYYDNSDCNWLISVPGANKISISFNRFAVESMDSVIIYNGSTTSSAVLAKYTGAT